MAAVSGGFSVEGKFRPFGQRLKQSQQDPNYTQPAHKGRRVRARGEVISWAISRASPTRPDNHREAGTRHHQTGYACQPPITGWGIMVLVVSTGRAVFAG